MNREQAENFWQDERNWRYSRLVYFCPDDPRIVVPQRSGIFGWTCNFAHRAALLVIFLFFVVAVLPTFFLILAGITAISILIGGLSISVLAVIALARAFAKRGLD
jgi:hypothetical protein